MRIREILGSGSVEKRSKTTYRLKLMVLYVNGKKERLSKTVLAENKTEAKSELEKWRTSLALTTSGLKDEQVTVSAMLDDYLEFCANSKNLELRTLEGYRKITEEYLRPAFGDRYIDEITPEEVENYFSDLHAHGGLHDRPLSGNTCKRILSVLSPMFQRAIFHQYIASNPCEAITMPRVEKEEIVVLPKDEIDRLLSLLPPLADQRLAMVIRLALFTGCRRGELCGLKWQDIDFEHSTIHVRHSLVEVTKKYAKDGEALHLKGTKTNECRNLVIDSETLSLLHEHKARQYKQMAECDTEQTEESFVFADVLGGPYRPSTLTNHFEVFVSGNGFNMRFQDLRHAHASILISCGESIVTVSKRLGHKKVSTTLDIYSHLMPGDDRALAETMSKLFNKRDT